MKKRIALFISLFVGGLSCTDFDVENLNAPDGKDVLNYERISHYAEDLYREWFNGVQSSFSPNLAVLADQFTYSFSWWPKQIRLGNEPRQQWDNRYQIAGSYTFDIWQSLYNVVNAGSDILGFINSRQANELEESEREILTAWSNFNLGISLGYIALLFDRGFINTDDAGNFSPELVHWYELIPESIKYLDRCIEICNNHSFILPDNYIAGTNYSNLELKKLSNTFAARIIANSPRNATQNDTLDWTKVLQNATNGIDFDHNVEVGQSDVNNWEDWFKYYSINEYFFRIDHRIINLLDPQYPHHYPSLIWPDSIPEMATSADARLSSDFGFEELIPSPSWGIYSLSHYSYCRYHHMMSGAVLQGIGPLILRWENDLLIAEALVRTDGDPDMAIAILNDPEGPRKSRGELPDIPMGSGKDYILDVIFYERDIELIATGLGISFFDMRRRDMMQTGSLLHFPIPEVELPVLGIDYYTFGGVENADGINTSNGGWL
jgi:hypothetical protein